MNLLIDEGVPSVVCGERRRFEQILFNLLIKILHTLYDNELNIICRLRGVINKFKKSDFTI